MYAISGGDVLNKTTINFIHKLKQHKKQVHQHLFFNVMNMGITPR
jgi:hypothetical protein